MTTSHHSFSELPQAVTLQRNSAYGVLTEIGDIIIDFLNEEGLELKEGSFFTRELKEVHSPDRQGWLRTYLSENTTFLLQALLDQAYSMDLALTAGNRGIVSLAGRVALRTMLEYSYKLVYLTDAEISATQRIKRAIEMYYTDLHEYERMPLEFRGEIDPDYREIVRSWYREITEGKELRPLTRTRTLRIFNAIGDPSEAEWIETNNQPVNPVYTMGYQVNSLIAHGNLWAIQHYGRMRIQDRDGTVEYLSSHDVIAVRALLKTASSLLQSSFAFAVQFMHGTAPSGTLNRMRDQISLLMKP